MKYLTDKYILLPFVEKTDFLYTKYSITPNQITITNGLIITNFFLYFILNGNYCISSIFLFLRLLLDGSDGYIARKYKLYSKEGDIYDHISDSIFMGQLFMIFVYKLYFHIKYIFVIGNIIMIGSMIGNYDKNLYWLSEKIFGAGGNYDGYCSLNYIMAFFTIMFLDYYMQ